MWYNIYRKNGEQSALNKLKGERVMKEITKALKDLAKAVNSNDTVERVNVTITLKKPKSSKAKTKSGK